MDDDLHAISPEHYDLVEAGDVPGSPNNENWAKPPFKNQYMLKRGGKRTSGGKPKKMRLEGFKLGCPRGSFFAISSDFLYADKNVYCTQHTKNIELARVGSGIKFLLGRVLLIF